MVKSWGYSIEANNIEQMEIEQMRQVQNPTPRTALGSESQRIMHCGGRSEAVKLAFAIFAIDTVSAHGQPARYARIRIYRAESRLLSLWTDSMNWIAVIQSSESLK
jgi:hypothetical protein